MKKRQFLQIICAIFAISLMLAGCKKENSTDGDGIQKAKGGSTIEWNGAPDRAVAVEIGFTESNKANASGPKIPSNAHSADFPGIYFIWDSKQKDNGYLKVSAEVFEMYESFTLTSKESNKYFDFLIQLQNGQQKTADNCYVFFIPKVYNNKNINMVFVSEFVEKEDDKCYESGHIEPIAEVYTGWEIGTIAPESNQLAWNNLIGTSRYLFDAMAQFPSEREGEGNFAKWILADDIYYEFSFARPECPSFGYSYAKMALAAVNTDITVNFNGYIVATVQTGHVELIDLLELQRTMMFPFFDDGVGENLLIVTPANKVDAGLLMTLLIY